MQNYTYRARDVYGKSVQGIMLANDEIDLSNKLSKLGYFLIRAKVVSEVTKPPSKLPCLKPKEVLDFTIHLDTLLDASISLIQALQDLARDAEKEKIREVIDDICHRIESGTSLKEAIAFHSNTFSPLYIAVVGAGESTGKLSSCLNDLVSLLEWQLDLRSKIKEIATYPTILFCVMIGVVTLLVVKVIPAFEPIFQQAGVDLPLPTQIVLGLSYVVRKFWYLILGASILLIFGYKIYGLTATGKFVLDSIKLKFPLFGMLLRKIALTRFCRTFTLALRSGLNMLSSLDIAAEVIGNERIKRAVIKARASVNVGEKVSTSFQVSGEFPPLVVRMLSVGEESGAITHTLEKVNKFYEREIPATIKKIFMLFEPIMIVIMGIIVGGVALSIFLPMFKMISLIGG